MTDEQIVKALKTLDDALDLIKRQQADKERLEIELQTMRIAANSYKSRVQTLEMDNAQLHSDIVNANQNFDHINGLWEAEKEKVEKAKQKVINICKELQKAKVEIEKLEDKLYYCGKTKYEILFQFRRKVHKELNLLTPLQFLNPLQEAMPITEVALLIKDLLHNVCTEVIDNIIQEETVEEMTEKEGGKG